MGQLRTNKDLTGVPCCKCSEPAFTLRSAPVCEKHERYIQMRCTAQRSGKYKPTDAELDALVPVGMKCPECGNQMKWKNPEQKKFTASLQHYRDGTLAIVCISCNVRHGSMPGDSYREMPKDCKRCPKCELVKPRSLFITGSGTDRGSKGFGVSSKCRKCVEAESVAWRKKNREAYNALARKGNARHRAFKLETYGLSATTPIRSLLARMG